MDIQFEIQKIHSQYGTTEMANYQIQKLFDKAIQALQQRDKPITLDEIEYRIKEEYKKHKELDWAKIAASKIYSVIGQQRESDKLPTIDEAGIAAVKITETLDFKLTAQEQAFFIAGFTECIKWLSLPTPPNK